jgi:hypothetical protein
MTRGSRDGHQVNGKVCDHITVPGDADEETLKQKARDRE